MAPISCAMTFVALLASDLNDPVSRNGLFSRIFDSLIFLFIPEFRAGLRDVLLCYIFHTRAS